MVSRGDSGYPDRTKAIELVQQRLETAGVQRVCVASCNLKQMLYTEEWSVNCTPTEMRKAVTEEKYSEAPFCFTFEGMTKAAYDFLCTGEKAPSVFAGKTLLITGGTGSFGNAVLRRFLDSDIKEIRIFSRDEKKQDDMRHALQNPKVKFYIGDVRNKASVDAETGILVPPYEGSALYRAMLRLLGDPVLRSRLGLAARARMESRFDRRYVWRELQRFYAGLLQ